MSWRNRWVVLVPGKVAWVERRTRELLEEEGDGSEHCFMVIPGQGRYQAVVEKDYQKFTPEMLLGRMLSLECEEPVYSIERHDEFPSVLRFLKGEQKWEHQEPEDLGRALGCVMPWDNAPARQPLQRVTRKVVLIQGLSKARVLAALEKQAEFPLREGHYCLEEVPHGLLLRDGTGVVACEDIDLEQRFPRATIYSVVSNPGLDVFVVNVSHDRRTQKFALPPREFPLVPVLHEVMGERTPERILAALGMSKEWFQL